MAQTQPLLSVQNIAETHLAQVVPALLVVPALRQFIARVGAGDVGVEVGGVVSQQTTANQLFLVPQTEQTQLGLIQRIFLRREGLAQLRQNLLEGVPESLRAETLGGKSPLGGEDGALVPVGDFRLGTGIADAMNGCQQQVVSRARSGTRRRP